MSTMLDELVIEILLKLQLKSLLRCKSVCKSWQHIIESRQFMKIHLDRKSTDKIILRTTAAYGYRTTNDVFHAVDSCFDDDADDNNARVVTTLAIGSLPKPGYVIGLCSCDGLLLVAFRKDLLLWNPGTRKFKVIARPKSDHSELFAYGFGYDSSIDDYKIVTISQKRISDDLNICVFTLKTNSWRSIRHVRNCYKFFPLQSAVFLKGCIHFRGRNYNQKQNVIVGFSLAEERMKEMSPIPPNTARHVMVLGGNLSLLSAHRRGISDNFEVWSMMDYDNSNSWTKIICFPYNIESPGRASFAHFQPVCIMKNGNILLGKNFRELLVYDKEKGTLKQVFRDSRINGYPIDLCGMVTYKESLVSPSGELNRSKNLETIIENN